MKIFNKLLTFFTLLLSAPTILILVSWNALPGDSLYRVKTGLEDVALVLTARTPVASAFSVKFTERRFSEADKLLTTQGSTVGFALLVEETQQSKQIITQKNDTKNAARLVAKIEEYQKEIEEKQQIVQSSVQETPTQPAQTPTPTPHSSPPPEQAVTIVEAPAPPKPSPVVVPQQVIAQPEKAAEVAKELEKTNKELERIKEEIQKSLPEAASEKAKQKHKNDDKNEED